MSTPLDWKEVNEKFDPKSFKIDTIRQQIEEKGDLFEKVTDKKVATGNTKTLSGFL